MDPAKLKVVELRSQLSQRGLDTKGNKAVLVERLRKALEEETENSKLCVSNSKQLASTTFATILLPHFVNTVIDLLYNVYVTVLILQTFLYCINILFPFILRLALIIIIAQSL